MKNIITGNLVSLAKAGEFDVIIHGCNCFNSMGKGIALDIKNHFPNAYIADTTTNKGDRDKLGLYTGAACYTNKIVDGKKKEVYVINAYTQYDYWSPGILVDYDALEKIFTNIGKRFRGSHIAYPAIGAGLAKGDWDCISSIIDKALIDCQHTYVLWDRSKVS